MEQVRKHSRKRDAILACLRSSKSHPTAEWIYRQLKAEFPDLSLGTVYRNLGVFRAEGIVQSIGVVNGLERYDGNPQPHSHFVCQCCGAVTDLESLTLPWQLLGQAREDSGGEILSYQLQFTGRCAACKGKKNHTEYKM